MQNSREGIHEAGHAVVAVHLGVPFTQVDLAPKGRPIEGNKAGAVDIKFRREFSSQEAARAFMERVIVVWCAGKAAEDLFGVANAPPGVLPDGDRKGVQEIRERFQISDARMAELQRRAERLVHLPHIGLAILHVADVLITEWREESGATIEQERVRKLYRLWRKFHSRKRLTDQERQLANELRGKLTGSRQ